MSKKQHTLIVSALIERAHRIPKTDLVGHSDPYIRMSFGGKHDDTDVASKGAEPIWYDRVTLRLKDHPGTLQGPIRFELWDKDTIGGDDAVAHATLDVADVCGPGKQTHRLTMTLHDKVKSHPDGPPELELQVGAILGFGALKHKLAGTPGVVASDDDELYIPLPQIGDGVTLHVEVEGKELELELLEATPIEGHLLVLGHRSGQGFKVKRRRYPVAQLRGTTSILAEQELDDVPVYTDFNDVVIQKVSETPTWQATMDTVVVPTGWTGALTFEQAKESLQGIIFDDKKRRAFFPTEHGFFCHDWDRKEGNMAFFPFNDGTPRMVSLRYGVHELSCSGKTLKRPLTLNGKTVRTMLELDDLPYPTQLTELEVRVFDLSQAETWPLHELLPLWG